jgi:hypothetical protein
MLCCSSAQKTLAAGIFAGGGYAAGLRATDIERLFEPFG